MLQKWNPGYFPTYSKPQLAANFEEVLNSL